MQKLDAPRKISGRKWLLFAICFVSVMVILILAAKPSVSLRPFSLSIKPFGALAAFVLYLSMAFTLCPLPIYLVFPWIIQYFNPYTVAFLGAIATSIANLHDYHIFHRIYQLKGAVKLKEKDFYKESVKWFEKAPFIAQAVVNFSPLPIDVVRLLAISVGYPRWKFALATFVGRFPRYLIIAWGSGLLLKWLDNVMLAVFAILVIAFLLMGLGVLVKKLYRKKTKTS
ncbi:MAG: VTT domain-containing protein [Candidatus Omnitrophica bacterium]|nr:VTT domain-containing protein [Candidatus Omnitrophota bacterium]